MKNLLKTAIAAGVIAGNLALAGIAEAASFRFSYTTQSGNVLAGELEGALQADGDTVLVSNVFAPTFNGLDGLELTWFDSTLSFLGIANTEAAVSFSGSTMDLIACTDSSCFDGFLFESSGVFGSPYHSSSSAYGNAQEAFNAANWELESTDVPEPSLVLGTLLAVGVGAKFIKRK